jgi:hypothetical protein
VGSGKRKKETEVRCKKDKKEKQEKKERVGG